MPKLSWVIGWVQADWVQRAALSASKMRSIDSCCSRDDRAEVFPFSWRGHRMRQLSRHSSDQPYPYLNMFLLLPRAVLPSPSRCSASARSPPCTLTQSWRYLLQVGTRSCLTETQAHKLPHSLTRPSDVVLAPVSAPSPLLICLCVSAAWPNACASVHYVVRVVIDYSCSSDCPISKCRYDSF